ncbi:peptide chain release factor N(5)-glutamine methyltransferase [Ponticaulis sp.]|uniref:peptide chain release factor N(5)-glutamine methyltransferase n=1 Tax=Ponticaulis sp. TaxID=2020902 RepID=UPI000B699033|nr:peptide chain release factor N(5)-glutamine methyltransferase [Ponticaulis sp.]MAI90227.1 protein-(glutamine-N5) methyltransferase, release factor-specific [Ponticaulis sp.]OUX99873.1 MAG: protein-(glutamine-N5) methyltransferase, release factor-specific [Hyphomonadaceae bacterium TMED5]|tara:strand:+ start:199270 stop:200121 length:852 start_codon:yes stop_codon:yes gene_type:complete
MSETYGSALRKAIARLSAAGLDEARAEAKFLLLGACDMSSSDLILNEGEPIPVESAARFEDFLQRRLRHAPVSLILGVTDFMGLSFLTDERALAPRSDSERLVEAALERAPQMAGKVVDLGTGSGCLLQSFLHERQTWTGTALDLSPDALSLAKENAARLKLEDRITFLQGSWATAANAIAEADIVISNPPYIRTEVLDELDPEVREHDPMLALDGGADGLIAYRDIVSLCSVKMTPGAWLLFEIGFDQAEEVSTIVSGHSFAELSRLKDYSGHNRVVLARKL